MAYFKNHANAKDLRDVQSNVLWEWAVATGMPLNEAATKFCREYRRFWPLTQLGDPLVANDRMFSIDEREVLIILRKLEEIYGKVSAGGGHVGGPGHRAPHGPRPIRPRAHDSLLGSLPAKPALSSRRWCLPSCRLCGRRSVRTWC